MGYWGLGLELIFFWEGLRYNSAHNTVLLDLIYYRSSPSEDEHRRNREAERPPQDLKVVNHKSRADFRACIPAGIPPCLASTGLPRPAVIYIKCIYHPTQSLWQLYGQVLLFPLH